MDFTAYVQFNPGEVSIFHKATRGLDGSLDIMRIIAKACTVADPLSSNEVSLLLMALKEHLSKLAQKTPVNPDEAQDHEQTFHSVKQGIVLLAKAWPRTGRMSVQ